jgi:type VI secretion system protein ImpA
MDIEKLLKPVATENPCGIDLRLDNDNDSVYHQLRENRNQARIQERKQDGAEEGSQYTQMNEYWKFILREAPVVLQEQSKDLEISCWLMEAQLRNRGFEGLSELLWFLNQLIIKYWHNLYPRAEEGDLEDRVACIQGLNGYSNDGALIAPIYMLSIVPDSSYEKISTWDYMQARSIEKMKDGAAKTERQEAGIKTFEELQKAIKNSDAAFYEDLLTQIEGAKQNLDALIHTLNEYCQEQAPTFKKIIEALNQVHAAVSSLTKPLFQEAVVEAALESAPKKIKKSATAVSAGMNDYQQAMFQLKSLTEFMQRTQPLSLITTHLTRLLRWSKMPMVAVISEMFLDQNLAMGVAHGFGVGIEPFAQQHDEADEYDYQTDNDEDEFN